MARHRTTDDMIKSAISEIFVAATGFDRHPIEFYRYDIGASKVGR